MCPNILVQLLSVEVNCFQVKSTQDIHLVIFVHSLLENYCLNNLKQSDSCHRTCYSKQLIKQMMIILKHDEKVNFRVKGSKSAYITNGKLEYISPLKASRCSGCVNVLLTYSEN